MGMLGLIIGESGSGKSTALRNLDAKKTFLINAIQKPLPFKGWKSQYTLISKENPNGNYFITDDYVKIDKILREVEKRKEIKTLIIDDFQYLMANEFMRRSKEKGYEKFTDIGNHAWKLIFDCGLIREDLDVFILSHTETTEFGTTKCKTIGKLLDDKITLEGMFTLVLESRVNDGKYRFITQNTGRNTAKSPMGMFDSLEIDNDLSFVLEKIHQYNS